MLTATITFALDGDIGFSGATGGAVDCSYDIPCINVVTQSNFNNQLIFNDSEFFCVSAFANCPAGNPGSITEVLTTPAFSFVVGQSYGLTVVFDNQAYCGKGSCYSDFGDPTITNIAITDSTTGLRVTGLNLIGDTGTVYPVNSDLTSVPEPGTLPLAAVPIFLMAFRSTMRRRLNGVSVTRLHGS